MTVIAAELFLVMLCLALAGFYAGAETAFISVNRMRLKYLADNGDKRAARVLGILEKPREFIATVLVGTNLFVVAASAMATRVAVELFLKADGMSRNELVAITSVIMTILTLLFAQVMPKSLFRYNANRYTLSISPAIEVSRILFKPVVVMIKIVIAPFFWMMGWDTDVFRGFARNERIRTRKDLELLFKVSHDEGVLEKDEHDMIKSVFSISDTLVREIMTPRVDFEAVKVDIPFDDLVRTFEECGYSRLPAYEGNIDNIVGIFYVMDIISAFPSYAEKSGTPVNRLMRKPYFIPETKHVGVLLKEFEKQKTHIAIAVDEYGGVAGLVTIEDILEEIVGDIEDEYDSEEEAEIVKALDNEAMLDGTARIDDINEEFGLNLPDHDDYDSISGFLFESLGDIPKVGEKVEAPDGSAVFEVVEADDHRIHKVRMKLLNPSGGKNGEGEAPIA